MREPLRRRLGREESGIALITAILVLLIVSVLAAAAITAAVDTSTSTTTDESRKAALAAAEAGVRVATYRLTMLNPATKWCVAKSTLEEKASGHFCSAAEEQLGNGASFTYQTTPALTAGEKCVGLEAVSQEAIQQRCVAATGTADGTSVRVEARVASFTARPLFEVPGIEAREKVVMSGGKAHINGAVGTNGVINAEGGAAEQYGGCELGPSGKYKGGTKACETIKVRTPAEGEIVFAPVNPGDSNKEAPNGECAISEEPEGNCDYRISNALAKLTPADAVSGAKFNASSRTLEIGAKGSVTLGAGVYNFCNLTGNKGTLTVAAGAVTEIFIDSPERTGSECPAGSGNLEFGGNIVTSGGENPLDLQIFVYGKNSIEIKGTTSVAAVIYAPNSTVKLSGTFTLGGAVAGNAVELTGNFNFNWDEEVKKLKVENGVVPAYYRTAWGQCTPEGTTPAIGC